MLFQILDCEILAQQVGFSIWGAGQWGEEAFHSFINHHFPGDAVREVAST